MSVDVEAGGALATAGLAAEAIEGQAEAKDQSHPAACANCSATLAGAYCHACGQTAHVHRSLWHMLEEGLHGVLHFDSKSWRTLPLLIARPGLLTRRYIDGQRVRYVSPLALFLFMIFLMFFVVSSVSDPTTSLVDSTPERRGDARAELAAELERAQAAVTERSAELAAATDEDERADAAEELEEAQAEARTAAALLAIFDKAAAEAATGNVTMTVTPEELRALTGWDLDAQTADVPENAPEVVRSMMEAVQNVRDNPELYLYKLKNTAYKFAFLLVPISLPFLWLMFFWRRDVTMYDHMVFSMYSLAFMSLLFVVLALSTTTTFTSRFTPYLVFVPPVHMFFHLRGTYGLSTFSALWRTFALLMFAATAVGLFMALIAVISYV